MTVYGSEIVGGPQGLTYAVLIADLPDEDLWARLVEARFSGYVGQRHGRWTVAVPQTPLGHVASGRRHLVDLGRDLTTVTEAAVLTAVVLRDELLLLWAGIGERTVFEYVSDPSVAAADDDLVDDSPVGAENAPALAALFDVPDVAGDLTVVLAARLGESENESERLHDLAGLLGLPPWLVSVASLPRDVAGGPPADEFVRLGAGRTGFAGWAAGRATRVVRRRD